MLPRYSPYLVAATLACACAPSGSSRTATLATLQHEIASVRRGEVDTVDSLPPLESLVGAHQNQLRAALGSPRVCEIPLEHPCENSREILWELHAVHAPGPILVVEVENQRVVGAHWRSEAIGRPFQDEENDEDRIARVRP